MAATPTLATAAANTMATALGTLLDGGYLRLYSGTQPATPDVSIGTSTLLAELRFDTPAFGTPAAGVLTANALTAEDAALANGTAAWARMWASNGTTPILDGSVGTGNANVVLDAVVLTTGVPVALTSVTIRVVRSA
jgi:hypothetical protein